MSGTSIQKHANKSLFGLATMLVDNFVGLFLQLLSWFRHRKVMSNLASEARLTRFLISVESNCFFFLSEKFNFTNNSVVYKK